MLLARLVPAEGGLLGRSLRLLRPAAANGLTQIGGTTTTTTTTTAKALDSTSSHSSGWSGASPNASSLGLGGISSVLFAFAGAHAVHAAVVEAEESKENPVLTELPKEPVTLYQYEVCPFCNKLRAFLDYNNIAYKVVEVNPLTKTEIKGMRKNKEGKLKVPIVMVPGSPEQMIESDDIINEFQRLLDERPGNKSWFGAGKRESEDDATAAWRKWVNDRFVHILTVNIYRSVDESFETFEYITDQGNFSFLAREAARYGGAGIMYFVSKNMKKKRDLPGEERPHLYEAAHEWIKGMEGKDYHGGKKPDLADLSVYGVIRTIEGMQTFKDMMANTDIGPWYYRVKEAVGSSARANPL